MDFYVKNSPYWELVDNSLWDNCGPLPVVINKVFLVHATLICLPVVCGRCHSTEAALTRVAAPKPLADKVQTLTPWPFTKKADPCPTPWAPERGLMTQATSLRGLIGVWSTRVAERVTGLSPGLHPRQEMSIRATLSQVSLDLQYFSSPAQTLLMAPQYPQDSLARHPHSSVIRPHPTSPISSPALLHAPSSCHRLPVALSASVSIDQGKKVGELGQTLDCLTPKCTL